MIVLNIVSSFIVCGEGTTLISALSPFLHPTEGESKMVVSG